MYQRSLDGASPEQLQWEFGLPAEEIEARLEATRLCLEKQCVLATAMPPRVTGRAPAAAGRD